LLKIHAELHQSLVLLLRHPGGTKRSNPSKCITDCHAEASFHGLDDESTVRFGGFFYMYAVWHLNREIAHINCINAI